MTKRLEIIYSQLTPCKKFADVGCDHGYIAEAMLEGDKAERVIISDISAPSLKKAEKLLRKYRDKVKAVLCDGLKKIDVDCDQVLIAGMGGEEIISILSSAPFLPNRLVLQPMKNVDKVRKTLLSIGYSIEKDFVFFDEKFYFLLVCERGEDYYTDDELFFGRDNLKNKSVDFIDYCKREYEKYEQILLTSLPTDVREELEKLKDKYGEMIK